MNKTILVAGGVAVASLATGAAGGYLYAKKRLTKEFDKRLTDELTETKKIYALRVMDTSKPADISQVGITDPDEEEYEPSDEEIVEAEKRAIRGKKALTDYKSFAKPPAETITRNIFTDHASSKKQLPPRDDSGKFVKTEGKDDPGEEDGPYPIHPDDFLANPFEYAQENLRYFADEDTLLDYANEVIPNGLIGEKNLKEFLAGNPEPGDVMCVRNEKAEHDYEIQYVNEPLTEYMGLAES